MPEPRQRTDLEFWLEYYSAHLDRRPDVVLELLEIGDAYDAVPASPTLQQRDVLSKAQVLWRAVMGYFGLDYTTPVAKAAEGRLSIPWYPLPAIAAELRVELNRQEALGHSIISREDTRQGPFAPPEFQPPTTIIGVVETPPKVTGTSYRELGEAFTANIRARPGGSELVAALEGMSFDSLGRALATLYSGGTATFTKAMQAQIADEDLRERLTHFASSSAVEDGLDEFFVSKGEKAIASYLQSVLRDEIENTVGANVGNFDVAAETKKGIFSLIKRLWGRSDSAEELVAMSPVTKAAVERMLGSDLRVSWDNFMATPEGAALWGAVAKEAPLPELSDTERAKLWERITGTSYEDADFSQIAIERRLAAIEAIDNEYRRLKAGHSTQEEFNAIRDNAIIDPDAKRDWELYETTVAATPPAPQQGSLQILDLFKRNLRKMLLSRNPLMTDVELLAMEASIDATMKLVSGDMEFGELNYAGLQGGALEDIVVLQAMKEKDGFADPLKVLNYIASGYKTTVNKLDFFDMVRDYFDAQFEGVLADVTPEERSALLSGSEYLWEWFLQANSDADASEDMSKEINPKQFLDGKFDSWIAEYAANPTKAVIVGGASKGTMESLFPNKMREIEESGTSLDVALSHNLSPAGQIMFALGVPLEKAEGEAANIFAARYDETVDEYFERVGGTLGARAQYETNINKQFKDTFGFLDADADTTRSIVESFGNRIVPEIVYVAEGLGLTMGDVQRRRDEMVARAPAYQGTPEFLAQVQALKSPGIFDFIETIKPIIQQLPVAQQTDAFQNAIMMEEQLRAEWQGSLPTDEEGRPLTGAALENWKATQDKQQADMITAVVERAVASQFGITVEEVQRLGGLGQAQEFGEGLQEIFAAAGELGPAPTGANKAAIAAGEPIGVDEEGQPIMPPVDIQLKAAEARQRVADKTRFMSGLGTPAQSEETARAAEIVKAMRAFRQAAPQGAAGGGISSTFEEFLRKQKGTRFTQGRREPSISPSLVTRRIS